MKEEWKSVLHSTWLKIVLIAIIAIPMLYSGIFLGSMWDPYGNASDIPVAVVNLDKKVQYQGNELDIGNELAQNLEANASMKFTFTQEAEAQQGLRDGSYYMIITIPKDFSKNATTLLEKNPKKMQLQYTTNPGTNYIATKMDDSAMAKIKEQVSATVTKTYADTLFSQVQELSTGLSTAGKGSKELRDGAKSAQSGSKTLQDNLIKLSDSTLTFEDGTSTLVKGLGTYTNGVTAIHDGSMQLAAGIKTLQEKSSSLPQGVNQLAEGSVTLQNGVDSYTDALAMLESKSKQLAGNTTALQVATQSIAKGTTTLKDGSTAVLTGLQSMSKTINKTMEENASTIRNLQQMNQNTDFLKQMSASAGKTKAQVASFDDKKASMETMIKSVLANGSLKEADKKQLTAVLQMLEKSDHSELQKSLTTLNNSSMALAQTMQGDYQMLNGLTNGLQQIQTGLNAEGSTPQTIGLIKGMQSVQQGLVHMDNSLNDQGGFATSITAYTAGVDALSKGATQINSNSKELKSGVRNLSQGMKALQRSTPALTEGIAQLNQGSTTLVQGSDQLVGNNDTLLAGANALYDGSLQLNQGAVQLSKGSATLTTGLDKLQDGSTKLHTSLDEGAEKSKLSTTDKTIDMVASPVELQHQEISSVENNGHAMAPYMMSVGLYVACMAFTLMYPLLKNHTGTKSGMKLWLSKASVMYAVSTLMAVVMIGVLMLVNGLSPYAVGMTIATAILVAAAFMSLIVFFSITCGKIGSFIVLIFMVMQLGGAAGTYPIETSSGFYNAIHPFMPFSYSVDAFRHSLAMGGNIQADLMVFVGMIVVFSLASILFYHWKASMSEEAYEKLTIAKFH